MKHLNHTVHIVLDCGATASLIRASEASRLKLKIWPTLHKAVQVDGVTNLKVLGEIHTEFTRGDLTLTFSALVVNKLGTPVLGGTNFLVENDVYCRMANDTVVIKGNNVFRSTSAEILSMDQHLHAKLVKVDRTQVILNGDFIECSLPPECPPNEEYFLDPRHDAGNFSSSPQIVKAFNSIIRIENEAAFPVKVKKNTLLAQVRLSTPFPPADYRTEKKCLTAKYSSYYNEKIPAASPMIAPTIDDVISQIQFNNTPKNVKDKFRHVINDHLQIFSSDLPGYNNHYGPVYASIQFGSRARPSPHKTRLPAYGSHGQKLASQKVVSMIQKGVLIDPYELGLQPALVNDSWVVKKPAYSHLPWDQCEEKHVRLVTAFDPLNKFLKQIPPKTTNPMLIYTHLANWKHLGELDFSDMYWQLKFDIHNPQHKKQLEYLCIKTIFGTYAYCRGPMGLLGMDAIQEELTDRVFGDLVLAGKLVKQADNLYFGGETQEEFLNVFQEILRRCQLSDLKLKASKINLNITHTDILGLHWDNGTLTPSAHKLDPLSVCAKPKTVKGLRSFLGAVRFHEICLPSKALAAATELLDKQIPSSRPGKDEISWDSELNTAFITVQDILKQPEIVHVPNHNDQLFLCSDGALSGPALGVKLLIKREGCERLLPSFNYGFRVKSSMRNWSPCEFEAYSLAQGIKKMKPFLRYVSKPSTALVDSKAVVEAVLKMEKGQFSTNRRLQDLLTNISSERLKVAHMSAKISSPILNFVDFGSRHPVECTQAHCTICKESTQHDVTFFGQVNVSEQHPPHVSVSMWKDMQKASRDCLRAVALLQSGKTPHRKEVKINDLREYLRRCTLNKTGLLVALSSETTHPFQDTSIDRVVVPQEFAYNFLTLLHKRYSHPCASQLVKLFNRNFFTLHVQQLVKRVTEACEMCAATKMIPKETLTYSTHTKPTIAGSYFNADVLVESSQKILVIRDNLTSFTDAMFISDEQKETLRNALIILSSKLRASEDIVIRTDPHSSLKPLVQDRLLADEHITIELGSPKNINKNAVAERAIQELRKEIVILSPRGGRISALILAKALSNLNTRIRHTGRSARELWIRRDQSSGEPLNFRDCDISDQQYSMRQGNHKPSAKHHSRGGPSVQLPSIKIGDKVFVKSDKSKSKAREPFFVIGKENDSVLVQKFTDEKNRQNVIPVQLQNIMKTPTSDVLSFNKNERTNTSPDPAIPPQLGQDSLVRRKPPSLPRRQFPSKEFSQYDDSSSSDEDEEAKSIPPDPIDTPPFSPPNPDPDPDPPVPPVVVSTPSRKNKHVKERWITRDNLSPRDRRALRSSARNKHSLMLEDGSLIVRRKKFGERQCSLCK